MQEYRVIIAPDATDDLLRVLDAIARESPQNAVGARDTLLNAMAQLNVMPRRYGLCEEYEELPFETRLMPIPPWRVIYSITDEPAVVRILVVQHGARQYPTDADLLDRSP